MSESHEEWYSRLKEYRSWNEYMRSLKVKGRTSPTIRDGYFYSKDEVSDENKELKNNKTNKNNKRKKEKI